MNERWRGAVGARRKATIREDAEHGSRGLQLQVPADHDVSLGSLYGSPAPVLVPKPVWNAQLDGDVGGHSSSPGVKRMGAG